MGFVSGHVLWTYELEQPVAELTALVVDDASRRSGAGRALVATCENWAVAHGAIRISLGTAFRRADAHAFYERLGYQQLARKYQRTLDPATRVNPQDDLGSTQ